MKMKTLLLATAVTVFCASSAMAADLTNPFYLPKKGNVTFDTKIQYEHDKYRYDAGKDKALDASAEITYGITDNLSVFGNLENEFDSDGEYNNDHNFNYTIGVAYNTSFDKVLAQVRASYYTFDPASHWGSEATSEWQKYLIGEIKLGYQYCKDFMPYMTYTASTGLDSSAEDHPVEHSLFVGAHKTYENWAIDAGLRYDFATANTDKGATSAQAEVAYNITDNTAVSVYGSYYLGGQYYDDDEELAQSYTAGLRFKFLF